VVVAAGNESANATSSAPANCSGVIAVAALRHSGTKVDYSNFGPQITISAPGGNCVNETGTCLYPILTTTNAGTTSPTTNTYSNSFDYSVGTSFSAPMVAGTIALMLSVDPALSLATIKSKLKSTARAFPAVDATSGIPVCHAPDGSDQIECYCTTSTCGAGILDAPQALAYAQALAAGQSYLRPNWPVEIIDTPELRAAVALGPDREAAPGPSDDGGGSGGGATEPWAAAALALACLAVAPRRLRVRRAASGSPQMGR